MSHFIDLDVAFYMHLTLYLFIYYNSQRFPITVNVHVKDKKQTHLAIRLGACKIRRLNQALLHFTIYRVA